jgi:hypothetical protein
MGTPAQVRNAEAALRVMLPGGDGGPKYFSGLFPDS